MKMDTEQRMRAAQLYADAYRRWHEDGDYSQASMKNLRSTRDAFHQAFPREATIG